eukprot:969323-Rhodomonas_salina.2
MVPATDINSTLECYPVVNPAPCCHFPLFPRCSFVGSRAFFNHRQLHSERRVFPTSKPNTMAMQDHSMTLVHVEGACRMQRNSQG